MGETNHSCETCDEDKTPGIFSWRELATHDIESSQKFHTELLGWDVDSMDMAI